MRIARNVRNTRPLMILKSSWKFVLNRLLPIPKPCDRFTFGLVNFSFHFKPIIYKMKCYHTLTMSKMNKITNHEAPYICQNIENLVYHKLQDSL